MGRSPIVARPFSIGTKIGHFLAQTDVQSLAMRLPIARWFARRDGAEMFKVVQGFVSSQILLAFVEFELLDRLADGSKTVRQLAHETGLDADRLQVFLQAGAALGFLRRRPNGCFGLARKGAALRGVPGLAGMILHHRALYRDLEDPATFLRGGTKTKLAEFWPYVLNASNVGSAAAERYSLLMTQSQRLVAEDTLRRVQLHGVSHLMDLGGGSGAFLAEVARCHPQMQLTLFDLPETRDAANAYLASVGQLDRVRCIGGNFRSDQLPTGGDAISLIRVLYDHDDATVRDLLNKVFAALPSGGRLIVSEPMSGGERPDPITDVYFAIYTLAMGTGKTRSAAQIGALLKTAGFVDVVHAAPLRSYITSTVTAAKPG